jgi:enoyl-CoA hydratase/carnithine racemase
MSESVRIDRLGDGVLLLALDRPHAANALDPATAQAFAEGLRRAQEDAAIGAVIVTGGGEKVFSAGVDLKNPDGLPEEAVARRRNESLTGALDAMLGFTKPLVVAVNGAAVGGGCMVALLGDRVVVSEAAYFSLPEIDIGMPTFVGLELLTVLGGGAFAADLVLTGRRMPAEEAARRGLATVVPRAELIATAEAAARSLAGKPRLAYRLVKAAVLRMRREAIERGLRESEAARPVLRAAAERRQAP